MMLYHPTSPDPRPALQCLQRMLEEVDFTIVKQSNINHWGEKLLRAMVLLRLEGAAEEARWAELVLRDRFSWSGTTRRLSSVKFTRIPNYTTC